MASLSPEQLARIALIEASNARASKQIRDWLGGVYGPISATTATKLALARVELEGAELQMRQLLAPWP